MHISEKFMTKYKNMSLTRKMLLVYFGFAGIFLVVAVIAFQISMEAFENLQLDSEIYSKLREAEREAELTDQRYSSKDVLKAMKEVIGGEQIV